MANIGQLIQASVTDWRDGRSLQELHGAEAEEIEFEEFVVRVSPLPGGPGQTFAVRAAVLNEDGETLAEARVEVKE